MIVSNKMKPLNKQKTFKLARVVKCLSAIEIKNNHIPHVRNYTFRAEI